jgi:D-lactate dehydrogenase (cytochrome)
VSATSIATADLIRTALPSIEMSSDAEACGVMAGDISGPPRMPAVAMLRPATEEQVVRLVDLARQEGLALHPRGGGWSYTRGYVPSGPASVMVDTALLQGIALDRDAATVTAGAGVTWGALHAALEAEGMRALSFGPLSGLGATIGGGAAQNGGFFGAAGHGALGDGTICGGTLVDGTSTVRHLTATDRTDGLLAPQPLVGDCGAFGIRTSVTLRVMKSPETTAFASFNFASGEAALAVLAGLPGLPCLGEAYVFDPATHANLAKTGFSVIESAGIAGDLLKGQGGLLGRIGGLIRTARAGKAFVGELDWSLHVSLDGARDAVAATMADITRRAAAAGGEAIPDVIPRVTRARPFRKIKALLGPDGEVWLPVHGVFAPADVPAGLAAVEAELAASAATMRRLEIRSVILAVLMGGRVIIEPQLFWPDALSQVHRRMAQPEQVAAYGERPANPAAREAAHALRRRLVDALDSAGAGHFQIGRSYAAHPGTPAGTLDAWQALKRLHDPDGIMNPGVLGL